MSSRKHPVRPNDEKNSEGRRVDVMPVVGEEGAEGSDGSGGGRADDGEHVELVPPC